MPNNLPTRFLTCSVQDANMLKKVISSKKIELESGTGRKSSARIRSRRSMHDGKKLSAEIAALEVCTSLAERKTTAK